jgi:hypothetical protein
MSVGFPAYNLVANQTTFTKGNRTWLWNGTGWQLLAAANVNVFTSSLSAPINPTLGDTWYKIGADVLYEYATDGYTSFWLATGAGTNVYSNATVTTLPATDNFSQFLLMGM